MIFDRTYWLLGLPFDAVDMEEAVRRIQAASASRRRLTVVTPNVNFVSMAGQDPDFRESVLDSQLSLVDGMPLVWQGRRAGIPFRERVAGSSLLERLAAERRAAPLKVFFFGGEPGVSEMAARQIPAFGPGLVSVGSFFPGFGSIDTMSTSEIITDINRARPDLLILSLGAKKGHQWIARNKALLEVPVITHLGAAVNFIAGTIRRAPVWMQNSGLEWLWRIRQEPQLFRRYWTDGLFFLGALRQQSAVAASAAQAEAPFSAEPVGTSAQNRWLVRGSMAGPNCSRFEDFVDQILSGPEGSPLIDLAGVTRLDARSLGVLYSLRYRSDSNIRPQLVCSSAEGLQLLRQQRADCLLSVPLAASTLQ